MSHNRRSLLKTAASLMLLPMLPLRLLANVAVSTNIGRVRPSDSAWPSRAAWKRLNDEVGANLLPVHFPLDALKSDPNSAAAGPLLKNLRNPFWVADGPGLTQTLGWVVRS